MNITYIPAALTGYEQGRKGTQSVPHDGSIKHIVMHISGGSLQSAINEFQMGKQKAAHFLVNTDGRVIKMVKEEDTAYHCGNYKMNLMSIGIEHIDNNDKNIVWSEQQIDGSAQLLIELAERYNLPLNRTTIKLHREVTATQCPGSVPVDKIIARALELKNGAENRFMPLVPYPKGLQVVSPQGLNVRNVPSTAGSILRKLKFDDTFTVVGFLEGEPYLGNNKWYKLDGEEAFVWSGATNDPTPVAAVKDPTKVTISPSDTWTNDELRLQNEELQELIQKYKKTLIEKEKKIDSLLVDKSELQGKIVRYEQETENITLLRNANESLSTQIVGYKDKMEAKKIEISKLNQKLEYSYIQAFDNWTLIEMPRGMGAVAMLPLVLVKVIGLIISMITHDYVIGWKKGARLYTVQDYVDFYGELPKKE